MGGRLSHLFQHNKSSADPDSSDGSTTPTQSLVDSLNDVAALHWLSLEQLYNLYIKAARTSFSFPSYTPATPATTVSLSPPASPQLSPCSPPSSQCTPRRHCANCCSRFSSKASSPPSHLLAINASFSPQQRFRLLSLEPNLPPASPADIIASPVSFDHCSYRPTATRDNLYCTQVRPAIEALLLDVTPLDRDDLSLVLDYLIDPPQLTAPQLVALALLSPQLLTDTKAALTAAAQSTAYSDLLLTASGCFTHRKGQIDRSMSLRAKQLRLNFATLQTGLYTLTPAGVMRLSVYGMSEFYFDQQLHGEKCKRVVSVSVEPFCEKRLEECRQRHELCMSNQLLLVSGQVL